MPRITKAPHERREEILDAAVKLFGSKGYQQTAVSDIVKEIGVAQGTFYYYFKSKEEVADAVIERHLEQIMPPFERLASDPAIAGCEKMKMLVGEELAEAGDHSDHDNKFQYLHHENNAALHQRMIVKMIRQFAPRLASVIEQGVREGDFRVDHPLSVAEFFLTGFQFWFDSAIFQLSEEEYEARVRSLGGIMDSLLGAKPGTFEFRG